MKPILIVLLNFFNFFSHGMVMFLGVLWYGKMPKVSIYHFVMHNNLFTLKQIFNDENIQGKYYHPESLKNGHFREVLTKLSNKSKYLKQDIPIFNDDNEKMGTETLYSFLMDQSKEL